MDCWQLVLYAQRQTREDQLLASERPVIFRPTTRAWLDVHWAPRRHLPIRKHGGSQQNKVVKVELTRAARLASALQMSQTH